jgi:hypothetical protein
VTQPRIGAYILPGDATWLRKSLRSYYPVLDDLVVVVPENGRGWRGQPLPVDEIRAIVAEIDTRGIAREVRGSWIDMDRPMDAETAQRQAGLDALRGTVEWVLQLDNDEYLPRPDALMPVLEAAAQQHLVAVEWPMRVLYRRTKRAVYEVVAGDGAPLYDYPGPIAARPDAVLTEARRVAEPFLRPVVRGDTRSLQVRRDPEPRERRWTGLEEQDAIVHNSWARDAAHTWRKVRNWGHADGMRTVAYFALRWYPSPVTWRFARDLHPFARGLWPRLARRRPTAELSDDSTGSH